MCKRTNTYAWYEFSPEENRRVLIAEIFQLGDETQRISQENQLTIAWKNILPVRHTFLFECITQIVFILFFFSFSPFDFLYSAYFVTFPNVLLSLLVPERLDKAEMSLFLESQSEED